ncbi:hypothetical protein HK097_000044 [Rhizophlyctis rosea]|uniref:Uncharacterized protein n=1 Tax=Rhizophlyctis rosea TaxID=64517 RepID=A0AAD5SM44_9FUNG|nr:hypothetical protein HK097_000044 [Rhizophlyctis rosea]
MLGAENPSSEETLNTQTDNSISNASFTFVPPQSEEHTNQYDSHFTPFPESVSTPPASESSQSIRLIVPTTSTPSYQVRYPEIPFSHHNVRDGCAACLLRAENLRLARERVQALKAKSRKPGQPWKPVGLPPAKPPPILYVAPLPSPVTPPAPLRVVDGRPRVDSGLDASGKVVHKTPKRASDGALSPPKRMAFNKDNTPTKKPRPWSVGGVVKSKEKTAYLLSSSASTTSSPPSSPIPPATPPPKRISPATIRRLMEKSQSPSTDHTTTPPPAKNMKILRRRLSKPRNVHSRKGRDVSATGSGVDSDSEAGKVIVRRPAQVGGGGEAKDGGAGAQGEVEAENDEVGGADSDSESSGSEDAGRDEHDGEVEEAMEKEIDDQPAEAAAPETSTTVADEAVDEVSPVEDAQPAPELAPASASPDETAASAAEGDAIVAPTEDEVAEKEKDSEITAEASADVVEPEEPNAQPEPASDDVEAPSTAEADVETTADEVVGATDSDDAAVPVDNLVVESESSPADDVPSSPSEAEDRPANDSSAPIEDAEKEEVEGPVSEDAVKKIDEPLANGSSEAEITAQVVEEVHEKDGQADAVVEDVARAEEKPVTDEQDVVGESEVQEAGSASVAENEEPHGVGQDDTTSEPVVEKEDEGETVVESEAVEEVKEAGVAADAEVEGEKTDQAEAAAENMEAVLATATESEDGGAEELAGAPPEPILASEPIEEPAEAVSTEPSMPEVAPADDEIPECTQPVSVPHTQTVDPDPSDAVSEFDDTRSIRSFYSDRTYGADEDYGLSYAAESGVLEADGESEQATPASATPSIADRQSTLNPLSPPRRIVRPPARRRRRKIDMRDLTGLAKMVDNRLADLEKHHAVLLGRSSFLAAADAATTSSSASIATTLFGSSPDTNTRTLAKQSYIATARDLVDLSRAISTSWRPIAKACPDETISRHLLGQLAKLEVLAAQLRAVTSMKAGDVADRDLDGQVVVCGRNVVGCARRALEDLEAARMTLFEEEEKKEGGEEKSVE